MDKDAAPEPDKTTASPATPETPGTDRSHVQSVYPEFGAKAAEARLAPPQRSVPEESYQTFNGSYDIITLICGLAASTGYFFLARYIHNLWGLGAISGLLASLAIVFAFKSFRNGDGLTPLTVVGLSAATIAIVNIMNVLIARAYIQSYLM